MRLHRRPFTILALAPHHKISIIQEVLFYLLVGLRCNTLSNDEHVNIKNNQLVHVQFVDKFNLKYLVERMKYESHTHCLSGRLFYVMLLNDNKNSFSN